MIERGLLSNLPLLEGTSPCVIRALESRGVEVRFGTGEVIFLEGTPPRGWFIVLEGMVRVVRGSNARQHVIHVETRGGTLAEVPLFTDGVHPATAIAAEPTRCALLSGDALRAAVSECPDIGLLLARRLALRVEKLVHRLDERSAKSVRFRLIEFLLERAQHSPRESFSVGMTQQALAEELGSVREVVSREIRRLTREKHLIAIGGGRYRIDEPAALKRMAADE
jgi:CRP/FNR family transcriptional regulator